MLKKARIVQVDDDYLKEIFKENYSEDLLLEFSSNNYRGENLRKDFKVPVKTEYIKVSEDRKYIIKNKSATLSQDVIKITLELLEY